jgi:hypothetical protein
MEVNGQLQIADTLSPGKDFPLLEGQVWTLEKRRIHCPTEIRRHSID